MCVSNRIEQFSASYFQAGLSPILLVQVAHEQGVGNDSPGDGDDRPDDRAHHIGYADVVEDGTNDDADIDRHRRQSAERDSAVSHSSHLLSRWNELKAKGDFSPF